MKKKFKILATWCLLALISTQTAYSFLGFGKKTPQQQTLAAQKKLRALQTKFQKFLVNLNKLRIMQLPRTLRMGQVAPTQLAKAQTTIDKSLKGGMFGSSFPKFEKGARKILTDLSGIPSARGLSVAVQRFMRTLGGYKRQVMMAQQALQRYAQRNGLDVKNLGKSGKMEARYQKQVQGITASKVWRTLTQGVQMRNISQQKALSLQQKLLNSLQKIMRNVQNARGKIRTQLQQRLIRQLRQLEQQIRNLTPRIQQLERSAGIGDKFKGVGNAETMRKKVMKFQQTLDKFETKMRPLIMQQVTDAQTAKLQKRVEKALRALEKLSQRAQKVATNITAAQQKGYIKNRQEAGQIRQQLRVQQERVKNFAQQLQRKYQQLSGQSMNVNIDPGMGMTEPDFAPPMGGGIGMQQGIGSNMGSGIGMQSGMSGNMGMTEPDFAPPMGDGMGMQSGMSGNMGMTEPDLAPPMGDGMGMQSGMSGNMGMTEQEFAPPMSNVMNMQQGMDGNMDMTEQEFAPPMQQGMDSNGMGYDQGMDNGTSNYMDADGPGFVPPMQQGMIDDNMGGNYDPRYE